MKKIRKDIDIHFAKTNKNKDASAFIMEKNAGVSVVANGSENKSIFSGQWAKYLCDHTPVNPITSINGLRIFIDHIWNDFYEKQRTRITDKFQKLTFDKYGSQASYAACWFENKSDKTFFRWLSYGNSSVMIYNQNTDELLVPDYNSQLLGFLLNKGSINWKDEQIDEKFLKTGSEEILKEGMQIIVATNAIAEHLAISYLIIKAKDDKYWEVLSSIMKSDPKLSHKIFKKRNAFSYLSFSDLLNDWKQAYKNNKVDVLFSKLINENIIRNDDLTLQIISFDSKAPEIICKKTNHTADSLKQITPTVRQTLKSKKQSTIVNFRSNKEAFYSILLNNGIQYLYHFTDRSNIDSIKKAGGLYSWDYMERNNLIIPMPGGDNLSRMLDQRYNIHNFVRTSFCINHPMMYIAKNQGRIKDPVILKIDIAIVGIENTLFSDMNATKNGHHQGSDLADLKRVRFDICKQRNHFNLTNDEKPYYQAEVMVKEFIPLKYILNIDKI